MPAVGAKGAHDGVGHHLEAELVDHDPRGEVIARHRACQHDRSHVGPVRLRGDRTRATPRGLADDMQRAPVATRGSLGIRLLGLIALFWRLSAVDEIRPPTDSSKVDGSGGASAPTPI
jgi:hypothetical protein